MRKFTVGCLSGHACIRVQKINIALLNSGHRVYLASRKIPPFFESYTAFFNALSIKQMEECVKLLVDGVDLFHVHNEPSWFVGMVKQYTDKPVVLDVHDAYAARIERDKTGIYRRTVEEITNFRMADALVFPSQSFAEIVLHEYGLTQPHVVVPPACPHQWYRYDFGPEIGGLVYEGRVDLRSENDCGGNPEAFRYSEYEDLSVACRNHNIDLHLYTTRQDEAFRKTFEDTAILHRPRHIDELIRDMSRHHWGLVGNLARHQEWDVAMPNKLFEYLASGLPVAVMNAAESANLVREYGIGIVVESVEELKDRWEEHLECRKRVMKLRRLFSMEQFDYRVTALYEEVLG